MRTITDHIIRRGKDARHMTNTPASHATPQEGLPPGAVQFEIGICGPHPVPLIVQCRPISKQNLIDVLHASVEKYYEGCASLGLPMHADAPVIRIATKVPGA